MNKLKFNFIYNMLYQILILIIPLLTTPYVARTIGAEGVGTYSYTYSIVNYFMMFALLGMNNYGNREIARIKDDRKKMNHIFSSIYYLQLGVTIITIIIYAIYTLFVEDKYYIYSLIQVIYLFSVAFDINWFFCGIQEFKITITRSAIIKIGTFISIFIFVKNENDLWKYIFILAFSTLINQISLWPFLKRRVKFVKVKIKDILIHFRPTLILFIPVIAMSVYRVMDKIMVGNIFNIAEVGFYENAEKIINIVLTIIGALGTVTLPQMTSLYKNNKLEEYYRILDKSICLVFFLVIPIIFGFFIVADEFIVLYLGEEFIRSALLIKILSFSLLFSPIASIIRMQLLIPKGKDKEYIISIISGAVVNLILNFILIPKFGACGASFATIAAEFLVFILQYFYIKEEIKIKKYLCCILKFAITSIIMAVCIFCLGRYFENGILKLILQVMIGATIYFALNISYVFSLVDISKVLNMIKKKE